MAYVYEQATTYALFTPSEGARTSPGETARLGPAPAPPSPHVKPWSPWVMSWQPTALPMGEGVVLLIWTWQRYRDVPEVPQTGPKVVGG